MAETLNRGPLISVGSGMDARVEPFDGPSLSYQGDAFTDPRFTANKDSQSAGAIKGYFCSQTVTVIDNIPSTISSTMIAAAQAPSTTAGVAIALVTAQAGTAAGVPVFCPGVPYINFSTGAVVTASAIDFGFTTGTTAANSSTVTVVDNGMFTVGQWVFIPGVGGTTNVGLFTQIQTKSTNTTVITISPNAQTALNNVPIGQANLYNQFLPPATQFGPSAVTPTAVEPYKSAGFGLMFDAKQALTRTVTVQAAASTAGTGTFTVSGADIYGVPMTELLTASGTTSVAGKKAFKYINSIVVTTPGTTVGAPSNVTFGVSDIFGLPLRSDLWEPLEICWNGGYANTNAGWTAALGTTSTATTADVRGCINASTLAVATVASTNGARRLTVIMNTPLYNLIGATPISTTSLFGVTQA